MGIGFATLRSHIQFSKFDAGNKGGLTWREFAQCVFVNILAI